MNMLSTFFVFELGVLSAKLMHQIRAADKESRSVISFNFQRKIKKPAAGKRVCVCVYG